MKQTTLEVNGRPVRHVELTPEEFYRLRLQLGGHTGRLIITTDLPDYLSDCDPGDESDHHVSS